MGEIGLMKNSITISLNVVDSLIKLGFKAFQHFSIKSTPLAIAIFSKAPKSAPSFPPFFFRNTNL